jgi:hypothetical protein
MLSGSATLNIKFIKELELAGEWATANTSDAWIGR